MTEDTERRKAAKAEFKRMLIWIAVAGVIMVGGALWYLSAGDEPMSGHMIIAAVLGVFISVLIGGGLMAVVFFSSKSGQDEAAGERQDEHRADNSGRDRR